MERFLWLTCLVAFFSETQAFLKAQGTDNPDIYLGTASLAVRYGYPAEAHTLETQDGYIIDIYRIRHGKNQKISRKSRKPVVLIQHAYQASSVLWLIAGKDALPFLLADAGYDVWLGSQRGDNKDGVQHRSLRVDKEQFWDFSWDEIAAIDMPTIVDHILNNTKVPSLTYVGHSLGGAIGAAMLSQFPEYNEKINLFVGVAPAIYLQRTTTPQRFVYENYKEQESFKRWMARNNAVAINTAATKLRLKFCSLSFGTQVLCKYYILSASGLDPPQFKKSLVPVFYSHFPVLTGSRAGGELGQHARTGEFKRYDFGLLKNLEVYNATKPPLYPLENVQTKVALFTAKNDYQVNFLDVERAARELPNVVKLYYIPYRPWGHYDYIFAKDAKKLAHEEIIRTIKEFAPNPRKDFWHRSKK